MTTGELENQLMEFNEDERFYQQYYNVKQDKWMLEDFLKVWILMKSYSAV